RRIFFAGGVSSSSLLQFVNISPASSSYLFKKCSYSAKCFLILSFLFVMGLASSFKISTQHLHKHCLFLSSGRFFFKIVINEERLCLGRPPLRVIILVKLKDYE